MPAGNRTPDEAINELSVAEARVVVTKDGDFVDSLILRGVPYKLLFVSTGNISNSSLEDLLFQHLEAIVAGFNVYHFIEINQTALISHF